MEQLRRWEIASSGISLLGALLFGIQVWLHEVLTSLAILGPWGVFGGELTGGDEGALSVLPPLSGPLRPDRKILSLLRRPDQKVNQAAKQQPRRGTAVLPFAPETRGPAPDALERRGPLEENRKIPRTQSPGDSDLMPGSGLPA